MQNTWRCVVDADPKTTFAICEAFLKHTQLGHYTPDRYADDAIFTLSEAGLTKVYFSPTMGTLATAFGAQPCAKPDPKPSAFALLGGDEARVWDRHFPGLSRESKGA